MPEGLSQRQAGDLSRRARRTFVLVVTGAVLVLVIAPPLIVQMASGAGSWIPPTLANVDAARAGREDGEVARLAANYGVRVGAINPNVFEDQIYKHGSLGNPDRCLVMIPWALTPANRVVCPVALKDIAVHPSGRYPEKVKAKGCCGPVYEVDEDGKPVSSSKFIEIHFRDGKVVGMVSFTDLVIRGMLKNL